MTIPPKVKIGALWFKIIQHAMEGCGACDVQAQVIEINSNLSDRGKELALWHEMDHAFNNQKSELQVEYDAQFTVMIIADNPGLYEG